MIATVDHRLTAAVSDVESAGRSHTTAAPPPSAGGRPCGAALESAPGPRGSSRWQVPRGRRPVRRPERPRLPAAREPRRSADSRRGPGPSRPGSAPRRGRPGSTPRPPPSTWLAGARPWSWVRAEGRVLRERLAVESGGEAAERPGVHPAGCRSSASGDPDLEAGWRENH